MNALGLSKLPLYLLANLHNFARVNFQGSIKRRV